MRVCIKPSSKDFLLQCGGSNLGHPTCYSCVFLWAISPRPIMFPLLLGYTGRSQSRRLASSMLLLHVIDCVFDSTSRKAHWRGCLGLGASGYHLLYVWLVSAPDKPCWDRKVQKIIKPVKKAKEHWDWSRVSEPIFKKSFHHQRTSNAHSTFGYANSRRIIPRICIMLDVFQSAFPVINLQEALLPLET